MLRENSGLQKYNYGMYLQWNTEQFKYQSKTEQNSKWLVGNGKLNDLLRRDDQMEL